MNLERPVLHELRHRPARRRPLAVASLLLMASALSAQSDEVLIDVDLMQAQTQTATITHRLPASGGRSATSLHMPTWRPGRYAEVFPAATTTQVRAREIGGGELPVRKVANSTWRVEHAPDAQIEVTYTVYANSLGNRTRHIDATHAFLSGSTVFLYTDEDRDTPHRIRLRTPEGWRIACGLDRAGDDPSTLVASSYDELVDAPIEVGLHDRWDFDVLGREHSLVVWPTGARFDSERVIADLTTLVEEQTGMFREVPYERYLFLVHAGAGAGGGTEHRNSTIMQTSLEALESSTEVYADEDGELVRPKDYRRFLGLSSHEFFHTWNVKEIRPADLVPYDYQGHDHSVLLWVSEGSTSYYDDLTLLRAGLQTESQYLEALGDSIDGFRNRPGREVTSLSGASYDSWIQGYGSSPNAANRSISFYRKGSLATLLLDFAIRRESGDTASFDDAFRRLEALHGLDRGGFSEGDLRAAIATVLADIDDRTPDQANAQVDSWFADWVDGTAPLPLEAALERVGLELLRIDPQRKGASEEEQRARPGADLGVDLADRSGKLIVSTSRTEGPAWKAGIQAGDEIVAVDGRHFDSAGLKRRLRRYAAGDRVPVHLLRADRLIELEVELGESPVGKWRVRKVEEPSDTQRVAYEAWTGQEWPAKDEQDDEGQPLEGEPTGKALP